MSVTVISPRSRSIKKGGGRSRSRKRSALPNLAPPKVPNMTFTWFDRFEVVLGLYQITKAALPPTLSAIFANLQLLLHPSQLREIFFQNIWTVMGNGVDERSRESKEFLLPFASGVVLEIGAGHGHSAKYLDKNKVTKYVALEPNPFMHDIIRQKALAAGFEPHQIQVIGCGAEHVSEISRKLDGVQVDCIISILTLCGISDVKKTVNDLVTTILKPKGIFIFYEHGQCDTNPTIAWWQSFWTPIWQLILGCRLDTPTPEILKGLDLWENTQTWQKKGETPGLFCHRLGCFTKRDNL